MGHPTYRVRHVVTLEIETRLRASSEAGAQGGARAEHLELEKFVRRRLRALSKRTGMDVREISAYFQLKIVERAVPIKLTRQAREKVRDHRSLYIEAEDAFLAEVEDATRTGRSS